MDMQAAVLTAVRQISYTQVPVPDVGADEVLVQVSCCGVCGSEVAAYQGRHKKRVPPVIMGHEVSGTVAVAGRRSGLRPGVPVTVFPMYGCGACPECRAGEMSLCAVKTVMGTQTWPGGFAQYVRVPAKLVWPLPEEMPLAAGSWVEPLAVALHAVRTAGVSPGDRVCVLGAGPVGLCTILMARQAGAAEVLSTDLRPQRLKDALHCGASSALRGDRCTQEAVLDGLGGYASAVFLTAPAPTLLELATKVTARRGKIIAVAMFHRNIPVDLEDLRSQEKVLTGTSMYQEEDFDRVIPLLCGSMAGKLEALSRYMPLAQAQQAFSSLSQQAEEAAKIFLVP